MKKNNFGYRQDVRDKQLVILSAGIYHISMTFRGLIFIVIAGITALFAACAIGPDYVKPKTAVPASYKEMENWKVAQPKDEVIRGEWWKIFNDPQLNELEEQVNISNQNIAVAEAQFRQARALVQVTQAGYFPTLTANPSVTRSLKSSNLSTTSGGTGSTSGTGTGSTGGTPGTSSTGSTTKSTPTVSDFKLSFDLSWEVDIWGKVRRTVESSRASAEASKADLEAVRLSMQAELAQDYFQLQTLDTQKQFLDATVASYQKSLDLTKNRYAGGIVAKVDVLQAEAQLNSTKSQAIDLGVQRAQLEHAIALLIGKPASDFSLPVAPLVTVPPPIPSGLPSELLERRPDISSAERRVAAANAQIGVAEAAFFPSVTLSALGGYEGVKLSKWLVWPSHFWSVGAAMAEPIFEGGSRWAQTKQARAAYEANVASYRQTVLTAFQEVEDNLAALRILEDEVMVQEEAVKASEQSLALTINQYKAGTVSYLNVIVAQVIMLNNKTVANNILGRRFAASTLLIKALGGGWDSSSLYSTDDKFKNDAKK